MLSQSVWEIPLIALAGAIGALSRYGAMLLFRALAGPTPEGGAQFPWATLAVNVLGCLAIGILAQLNRVQGEETPLVPPLLFYSLTIGYLGALTTFSSFSLESVTLAEHHHWLLAAGNVAANLLLCFAATVAGMALVKLTRG